MALEVLGLCPLLQVYDMPASVAFYRDILGFEVIRHAPLLPPPLLYHWALLRLGTVELMLNTAYENNEERPAVPEAGRVAAHGDTGLYLGCPHIDEAYADLRARGLVILEPRVAPYGMKQLYLRDPDGYALCLQWQA